MNGKRVESYIHSDQTTENKGGSLIELLSETDFAAKTDEFKAFAKKLAQFAYGASSSEWHDILEVFPDLENELKELQNNLGEKIEIGRIEVFSTGPKIYEIHNSRWDMPSRCYKRFEAGTDEEAIKVLEELRENKKSLAWDHLLLKQIIRLEKSRSIKMLEPERPAW